MTTAPQEKSSGQTATVPAPGGRRRLVQFFSLLALHSSWGPEFKAVCLPVLSCHSCALAWFACPIGVFVHYSGYHVFPYLALGSVLLMGVLAGRLLCGWVCPFGLLQDLLYKVPGRKLVLPRWTRAVKYAVLVLLVFAVPFAFGEQTAWSFCRFCPASALQVTIPSLVAGGPGMTVGTAAKLAILVVVLVLVVLSSRAFCKVLCPIGALLAPLNLLSFWRVKAPTASCRSCSMCDRACPTDSVPSRRMLPGTDPSRATECVVCHDCQRVCPEAGRPGKKSIVGAGSVE